MFERSAGEEIRTEWQAALISPIMHVVEQARAADLVVVRRRGRGGGDRGPLGVSPGEVLMEAGRPVLVVPPRLVHLHATRIVVA